MRELGIEEASPDFEIPPGQNDRDEDVHAEDHLISSLTHDSEDSRLQASVVDSLTTNFLHITSSMDHLPCNDRRYLVREIIEKCDKMNITNQNYQITRREAMRSLATFPILALGLTTPTSTVLSPQYGAVLVHCAASVEACWELYRGDTSDTLLAFKSVTRYLSVLQEIIANSAQHRKEALDLATRYALLKTLLGWICVGPAETIQYAKNAVELSQGTEDISLQLSASSKLAWAYFYDKKYSQALTTAQVSEVLLQQYCQRREAPPLHPCVQGGTYSTLALMQAKNRQSPDIALGKAEEYATDENYAFMTSKRSALLLETAWTYCYHGNQVKAMETLEQRIHVNTLAPKFSQSEMGRIETINIMALSSLKTKGRDMEKVMHLWTAGMQGAIELKNEQRFNEAVATYELMDAVWPGESRISDLRERIVHW